MQGKIANIVSFSFFTLIPAPLLPTFHHPLNTDLQAAKTEVAPGITCIKYGKTVIVNIDKEIDFHGGWNVIASLPYAAFGVTVMYGIFHTYGGDDAGIIRVYQKSLELEIQNFKEEKTIRARGAVSYITEG